MYARDEKEYFAAKRKAARQLGVNFKHHPRDLPSNAEIREQLMLVSQLLDGPARQQTLDDMRLEALRWMRRLHRFRPRLIGSVLTGHIRDGSDIDLHVFTDSLASVTLVLDEEQAEYRVKHKQVIKHHQTRTFRHVHIVGRFPVELTVYTAAEVNYPFRSSITGKPIEKTDTAGLEALLRETFPGDALDAALESADEHVDPLLVFPLLLQPLADVKQSPRYHPEGDALYHSLQVFELALADRPWDEEFVLAALLHDVGKAIDPYDHVAAGVEALDGLVTQRTLWLIAHHMDAHACRAGTLGARAARRLREHEDYDDLMRLSELDQAGRQRGAAVRTIDQAMDAVRAMGMA